VKSFLFEEGRAMFSRLTIALVSIVFCIGLTAADSAEPMGDQSTAIRNAVPTATLMTSLAEQSIKSTLATELTSVEVADQPLGEWIQFLSDKYHVPIQFDSKTLKDASIDPSTVPVAIQVKDIPLRSALRLVLDQHNLASFVRNDVLHITTQDAAKDVMAICLYDVGDLLLNEQAAANLIDTIVETIDQRSWQKHQGSGTIQLFDNGDVQVLVVSQNQDTQERIAALLRELRSFKQVKAAKTSTQEIASAPKK
jgi:hypothetical protein